MNQFEINRKDAEVLVPQCRIIGNGQAGGQKTVFPCEICGNKYALKIMQLRDISSDCNGDVQSKINAIVSRAQREISILKHFDSPYIVKLGPIDLKSTTLNGVNYIYYTEEWIEGKDLGLLLKPNSFQEPLEVVKIGLNIGKAIEELSILNIVHRDIKPQNILKRENTGEYVLIDLGLAFNPDENSLTQTGCVVGTPPYFSPEQLDLTQKKTLDFRSDLFSLGVVMYQTLTGQHPFFKVGMRDNELYRLIYNSIYTDPIKVNPGTPLGLNNVIKKMLWKKPNGRYRKCSLLLDELNNVYSELED